MMTMISNSTSTIKPIECSNRESIILSFAKYTNLSYDIIKLIIDQYYYDPKYEEFLIHQRNKKKYKIFQKVFNYYSTALILLHTISFILSI